MTLNTFIEPARASTPTTKARGTASRTPVSIKAREIEVVNVPVNRRSTNAA